MAAAGFIPKEGVATAGYIRFSKDVATLSKTHGSRVHTHARQMRTALKHMSTFIFTRTAAGVATATPTRSRGPVD